MSVETGIGSGGARFPTTHWVATFSASKDVRAEQMGALLARYWRPLYFFARRKGLPVEESKDCVQTLMLRLLDGEFESRFDPAKGRLRHYLKTALSSVLVDRHEARTTLKRGGGSEPLSLDVIAAEGCLSGVSADPDRALDREWALSVMERAEAALVLEFESGVRAGPVEEALRFFRPGGDYDHALTAERAGMTKDRFKAFLFRTRKRFRELVREEIRSTVEDPNDVDRELAALLEALT